MLFFSKTCYQRNFVSDEILYIVGCFLCFKIKKKCYTFKQTLEAFNIKNKRVCILDDICAIEDCELYVQVVMYQVELCTQRLT